MQTLPEALLVISATADAFAASKAILDMCNPDTYINLKSWYQNCRQCSAGSQAQADR